MIIFNIKQSPGFPWPGIEAQQLNACNEHIKQNCKSWWKWAAATFRSSQHLSILFEIHVIPCVSNYLDLVVSLNPKGEEKWWKFGKPCYTILWCLFHKLMVHYFIQFQIASVVGWLDCGPWWDVSHIPDWGAFSSLLSVEPIALYKSMIHFMVQCWCFSFHVFGSPL